MRSVSDSQYFLGVRIWVSPRARHQSKDARLCKLPPLVRNVAQLIQDVRDALIRSPSIAQLVHLEPHFFVAVGLSFTVLQTCHPFRMLRL